MTERLLHDYPSLNITLYIGMTPHEGLSKKNHEGFLNLTMQFGERIKVMYQITHPPTHIKLYSWIKDGRCYTHFVGSANFSENGLFKLNELMVENQQNFESLYLKQNKNSVPCTHPNIQKLITLYDDNTDTDPIIECDVDKELVTENDDSTYFRNDLGASNARQQTNEQSSSNWFNQQLAYITQSHSNYYDIIKIPVVFKNNWNNSRRGINNMFKAGQDNYLEQSNKYPFTNIFPYNTKLTFFTDDNEILEGRFDEDHDGRLYFYDDIYQYFANRLGVHEKRPISYFDLEKYNKDFVKIYKINDTEFLFDFSNQV